MLKNRTIYETNNERNHDPPSLLTVPTITITYICFLHGFHRPWKNCLDTVPYI